MAQSKPKTQQVVYDGNQSETIKISWIPGTQNTDTAGRLTLTNTVSSTGKQDFRKLIASALNATTSRAGVKYSIDRTDPYNVRIITDFGGGNNRIVTKSGTIIVTKDQLEAAFNSGGLSNLVAEVQSRSGIEIRTAIKQAQSTFQSAVFVKEFAKTSDLVCGALTEVASAFKKSRRKILTTLKGKSNDSRRFVDEDRLKMITDNYLGFQYGVKPLIADVDNGMRSIANLFSQPLGIPVKGSAEDNIMSSKISLGGLHGNWGFPIGFAGVVEHKVSSRSAAFLRLDDVSATAQGSRSLGGDFESFVPSLWEMLPYSFLIDYVSNAGDLLTALSTNNFSLGWAWTTTQIQSRLRCSLEFNGPYDASTHFPTKSGGESQFTKVSFNRSAGINIPSVSGFRFEVPNVQQAINTMILAFSKLN